MIFGPYSRFHFLETAQQNSSCFRGKGCQIIMGIVVAAYTFACLRRQNNAFREDGGSWFYWILPHLLRVADCLKDNGTTNQMGQKDVRGHSLSTSTTETMMMMMAATSSSDGVIHRNTGRGAFRHTQCYIKG